MATQFLTLTYVNGFTVNQNWYFFGYGFGRNCLNRIFLCLHEALISITTNIYSVTSPWWGSLKHARDIYWHGHIHLTAVLIYTPVHPLHLFISYCGLNQDTLASSILHAACDLSVVNEHYTLWWLLSGVEMFLQVLKLRYPLPDTERREGWIMRVPVNTSSGSQMQCLC